jgi:tetratricopeptide (TPR) repeat protein
VMAGYLAMRALRKYPYIPVGLFWYLGTLVPVIGLVQVGDQAMADRYTYIPLVGIFIIVSWGVPDLFKKRLRDQRSDIGGPKSGIVSGVTDPFNKRRFEEIFLGISAAVVLVTLSWESFFQLNTWKNEITLFEHAVSVTQNNYQAENNLGTAYGSIDLDKAVFHYQAALKIEPGYAMALYNLGTIYEKKGQMDKAISYYLKALKTTPDYFDALNNLGFAFYNKGNYDKAVLYFKRALKTNPKKTNARLNLANVLFFQSKPDEAISQYQQILQSDSENADAHCNLAYILSRQNKIKEAVHHYNEALRIDPKNSEAYYLLGNILLRQGKLKEAFHHYSKAIKFRPGDVQAYNKIGVILLKQGKFRKAGVFFSKALQIDPRFSEARANLEVVHKYSSTKGQ